MAKLAIGLALLGAMGAAASALQAAVPSFSKEIVPMFTRRCVACHMTGTEPGNISLTPKMAYAQLVGRVATESKLVRVFKGKPEQSYIIHKLRGTQIAVGGSGERMPIGGPPLEAASLVKITEWIEAGAPNN